MFKNGYPFTRVQSTWYIVQYITFFNFILYLDKIQQNPLKWSGLSNKSIDFENFEKIDRRIEINVYVFHYR